MAATYMYTYTILTGHHKDHDDWMKNVGLPFWQRQQGFRAFRSTYTLVGSGPDVVAEVDFESPDHITRALETPDAMNLWQEFSTMVRDLMTKILVPTHFA